MAYSKKKPRTSRKPRATRKDPETQRFKDNQVKAKERRAKARKRISPRIKEALDMLGFGVYTQQKESGISRGNILAWRGKGSSESPSIPGLDLAAVLAEAAGGLSLDWMAGFPGMPKYRSDRSELGALEREIHRVIIEHLATTLGVSAEFADSALGQTPAALLKDILEWVDKGSGREIKLFAEYQRDGLLFERWNRAPSLEDAFELELKARRRKRRREILRMGVSDLPDPDAGGPKLEREGVANERVSFSEPPNQRDRRG